MIFTLMRGRNSRVGARVAQVCNLCGPQVSQPAGCEARRGAQSGDSAARIAAGRTGFKPVLRRALLTLTAAFSAVAAHACSIPVFRYALDRWQADPFALEISATYVKDEAVARFLRNLTDSSPLNLSPSRSDEKGLSRLAFPHAAPDATPAWSGKLDGTTLPRITGSPARAEIVKRILAGECGVWVLVECGQRESDERAAAALEKRLRYLEQVAQVPPIDPNDPTSQLGPGPALRVKFSLLRIQRDNTAEERTARGSRSSSDADARSARGLRRASATSRLTRHAFSSSARARVK